MEKVQPELNDTNGSTKKANLWKSNKMLFFFDILEEWFGTYKRTVESANASSFFDTVINPVAIFINLVHNSSNTIETTSLLQLKMLNLN